MCHCGKYEHRTRLSAISHLEVGVELPPTPPVAPRVPPPPRRAWDTDPDANRVVFLFALCPLPIVPLCFLPAWFTQSSHKRSAHWVQGSGAPQSGILRDVSLEQMRRRGHPLQVALKCCGCAAVIVGSRDEEAACAAQRRWCRTCHGTVAQSAPPCSQQAAPENTFRARAGITPQW